MIGRREHATFPTFIKPQATTDILRVIACSINEPMQGLLVEQWVRARKRTERHHLANGEAESLVDPIGLILIVSPSQSHGVSDFQNMTVSHFCQDPQKMPHRPRHAPAQYVTQYSAHPHRTRGKQTKFDSPSCQTLP